MQEVFVPLKIEHFEDFKISNYGNFITGKGKTPKTFMQDGTLRIQAKKKKNHKIIARLNNLSVAKLVYVHFADNVPDCDFQVLHIDGDNYNCRFDNLKLSIGEPTEEQKEIYVRLVEQCVNHYLIYSGKKGCCVKNGIDYENIIGESYLLIYKHLFQYDITRNSFYSFCTRYIKMAFLNEYNKMKNIILMSDKFAHRLKV